MKSKSKQAFHYELSGGCGQTVFDLKISNKKFTLEITEDWMGETPIFISTSGIIKNKCDNCSELIFDQSLKISNNKNKKKQKTEIEFPTAISALLVTLSKQVTLPSNSKEEVFVQSANCGFFNNKEGMFNAILTFEHDDLVIDEEIEEDENKRKLLQEVFSLLKSPLKMISK